LGKAFRRENVEDDLKKLEQKYFLAGEYGSQLQKEGVKIVRAAAWRRAKRVPGSGHAGMGSVCKYRYSRECT
jgi:hypothetical protein